VAGWKGTTCSVDWDECLQGIHTCHNDATCINTDGSFECECDAGYTGTGFMCSDIDDCSSNIWENTTTTCTVDGPCLCGTCMDLGADVFRCTCRDGWHDSNCDRDVNECEEKFGSNLCSNYATCTNTEGSYTCACNGGYAGDGIACYDSSDCNSTDVTQCVHGTCTDTGAAQYRCKCEDGWTDRDCDMDLNECTSNHHRCHSDAECRNTAGSYVCICKAGFEGDGLENGQTGCMDINDCVAAPCQHGECADLGVNAYVCKCDAGFTDVNCDFDVDECYLGTHNCHDDAKCVNEAGGYRCSCKSGWGGDGFVCTDLDDCANDPCDTAKGVCKDQGANSHKCVCDPGWGGPACADDLNECVDEPCDPNADCVNSDGSFTCTCVNEYYGDGFACSPCDQCGDGYRKSEEVGGATCGLVNRQCLNIDECTYKTDDCADVGSVCKDTDGSHTCTCYDGYTGDGKTCVPCTVCADGFFENEECTSTVDTVCEMVVPSGTYYITSASDGTPECLSTGGGMFPERVNYCAGGSDCDEAIACGLSVLPGSSEASAVQTVEALQWKLEHLRANLYTISALSQAGWKCLLFENYGRMTGGAIYPSLQTCEDEDSDCPWDNAGNKLCGFEPPEGEDQLEALIANGQAVWKLVPLDPVHHDDDRHGDVLADNFLFENYSRRKRDDDSQTDECLAFTDGGAATNPERYNWGNGDAWCGIRVFDANSTPQEALLANKQAVFGLHLLSVAA